MEFRVEVTGLKELAKAGKQIDRGFGKALRQANLKASKLVLDRTHSAMRAGARRDEKATSGVKAKATQKMAAIRTTPGRGGFTLGVIWGQDRRSGWYARGRYHWSKGRQFRPWVGNQWKPGARGGLPYFLGPAMNRSLDEVVDLMADEIEKLARSVGL